MESVQADRLASLPPYLFAEMDRKRREALAAGQDVIDFGVGDPDRSTPAFIVDELADAIRDPAHHRYAPGVGTAGFRSAAVRFMARRFGVDVDPRSEVLALIGSKEGIGHLPLAVVNAGDVVLVPEPAYPVYTSGTVFAGGVAHAMPLKEESGWLPEFAAIPAQVLRRARVMWLNYPNNPTAAVAPVSFFEEAVAFARRCGLLIAHDAAYSEIYFGEPPPSILQVKGAKDVAVEFHSLSKTFNMTGWRIGFAVGSPDALTALAKVKSNLDSGVFMAIQCAAVVALDEVTNPVIRDQVDVYRRRQDVLIAGLRDAGWSVARPGATFYVWARSGGGGDSMAVCARILAEANVLVTPGVGFGRGGEGYVRFALTVSEDRTREAVSRLARMSW